DDRSTDAYALGVTRVVEGAGLVVVARAARLRGHRAGSRTVTCAGVALIVGTGDGRTNAVALGVTRVVEGAGVVVVALVAGLRSHRAGSGTVTRSGVALLVISGDRSTDAFALGVTRVVEGAGLVVVARAARLRSHRARIGAV